MTIIEALLFILFAVILVYFWILIMGLATMVTQQEDKIKELEKKVHEKE